MVKHRVRDEGVKKREKEQKESGIPFKGENESLKPDLSFLQGLSVLPVYISWLQSPHFTEEGIMQGIGDATQACALFG